MAAKHSGNVAGVHQRSASATLLRAQHLNDAVVGIRAIQQETFAVCNLEQAAVSCDRYHRVQITHKRSRPAYSAFAARIAV